MSVSRERPLVPKALSRSQGQLLSQGQPRPWVSRAGVPPWGKVSWGRTVPGKDTLSGLERGEPAIRGIPLSAARTFTSHMESLFWVPRQSPLGWLVQPKASLQMLLLSHEGCQRNPLFPPGLPSVEGWALQPGEAQPFLETVTRGAASAALDAACCSQ